jgi:hypothetical protein
LFGLISTSGGRRFCFFFFFFFLFFLSSPSFSQFISQSPQEVGALQMAGKEACSGSGDATIKLWDLNQASTSTSTSTSTVAATAVPTSSSSTQACALTLRGHTSTVK